MAGVPNVGNVSCPLQPNEASIPIVWHDIKGGVDGLRQVLRTLTHRDLAISPLLVNGLPVTPHMNPITNMTSHHIIRLWDSEPPEHVEHRYVLDLLMCDVDTYFSAFRRLKFATADEFAAFQAGDGGGQGGTWFSLQKSNVPPFLHAIEIEVASTHGKPRPGGQMVLDGIFNSLSRFERDDGGPGSLTQDVRRAIWNIMVMYCETRRLRSILVLVNSLLQWGFGPYEMDDAYVVYEDG